MVPMPWGDVAADVITWALTAGLGALAAWLATTLRGVVKRQREEEREDRERMDALCAGVRSLLRSELVRAHKEHVIEGKPMTLTDREYVERTYQAYHALGGNGMGTRLYNELMSCEVVK